MQFRVERFTGVQLGELLKAYGLTVPEFIRQVKAEYGGDRAPLGFSEGNLYEKIRRGYALHFPMDALPAVCKVLGLTLEFTGDGVVITQQDRT